MKKGETGEKHKVRRDTKRGDDGGKESKTICI